MAFVAVAIGAGALLGLGGAYMESQATKDAAQTQADASNRASNLQYQVYQQQRQDQQPWRQAGESALSQLQNPDFQKKFGASDFQEDPGYQFRMQQGMDAIQRSAAARGGLQSGGTMKALSDYGQNSASQEYQNAYNRFMDTNNTRFNRLASIAGLGQTANNESSAASQNYGNQVGQLMTGNANAQAAASIGQGQIMGNTLSSLGNGAANSWMQYNQMNQMNNWMSQAYGPSNQAIQSGANDYVDSLYA